ncbi:hypothetical protein DFH94DRAFT_797137 [Russula ochroleuca]|uniref:Uncharacterized protein n=1 Tax=Russula ochroleuca TaxID=152965 RepID=A0A9P5TED6_9AGAM|nr:hypothetical protein DFH94DRAFT_797137 [Russula ochroleuca]
MKGHNITSHLTMKRKWMQHEVMSQIKNEGQGNSNDLSCSKTMDKRLQFGGGESIDQASFGSQECSVVPNSEGPLIPTIRCCILVGLASRSRAVTHSPHLSMTQADCGDFSSDWGTLHITDVGFARLPLWSLPATAPTALPVIFRIPSVERLATTPSSRTNHYRHLLVVVRWVLPSLASSQACNLVAPSDSVQPTPTKRQKFGVCFQPQNNHIRSPNTTSQVTEPEENVAGLSILDENRPLVLCSLHATWPVSSVTLPDPDQGIVIATTPSMCSKGKCKAA